MTPSCINKISFHTEDKFSPEPLSHHTVNIEVEARIEDNEDMVEVSNTVPEARNGEPASPVAHSHPDNVLIL